MQRGLTSVLLSGALSCAPCLFNQQPSLLLLLLPLYPPPHPPIVLLFNSLLEKKDRELGKSDTRLNSELVIPSLVYLPFTHQHRVWMVVDSGSRTETETETETLDYNHSVSSHKQPSP